MNEEKKVPFKWEYGEETISLQLGMYANNQRLYPRYFLRDFPVEKSRKGTEWGKEFHGTTCNFAI